MTLAKYPDSKVLELRREGLSYESIAQRLGISIKTISAKISRALKCERKANVETIQKAS